MKKIILILFFFSLTSFVKGQEWVATFDEGDNDVGNFISRDNSGNICVAGTVGLQLLTIKYNSSGTQLWAQRFANPFNLGTTANGISIDNSNNVYVTGIFQRTFDTVTFKGTRQITTLKYNSLGVLQWAKYYGDNVDFFTDNTKMELDNSGNIIFYGSYFTDTVTASVVVKYDPSGSTLWTYQFSAIFQTINDIFVDNSQNIFLTGSIINDTLTFSRNCHTLKLNPSGNLLWSKILILNAGEEGYSITGDNAGNVFVVGEYDPPGQYNNDFLTIKYNSNGDTLWSRINNNPGNYDEVGLFVQIDNSGNVYAGGETHYTNDPPYVTGTSLIKYNASGTLQFREDTFNDEKRYFPYDMKIDVQNNLYFSGTLVYFFGPTYLFISKYNSSGDSLWQAEYTNSFGEAYGVTMAVDNSQNVFATGTQNNGADFDCLTLKYASTIGVSLISSEIHEAFFLEQNYPNPFNPETVINYHIKVNSHINLRVYNITGQEIETLVNDKQSPGSYRVKFNGSDLPSGVYFVKLETDSPREAGKFTDVKKMILEK